MRVIRTIGVTTTALALAAAVSLGSATAAEAAATTYKNCDAVHKVYSGGIAKKATKDNTVRSGGKVTHRAFKGTVKKDDALYTANKKLDADSDGIACELS